MPPSDEALAVRAVLAAQADAWNRGDIDGFCATCRDDVRYLVQGDCTVGRASVAARYRLRYPDRAAMGTLRLDVESLELRGADTAVAVVRWSVGTAGGRALLVLTRDARGWELAYDATM